MTLQIEQPIYSSLADDPDLAELVEMFVEEMPDRITRLTELHNSRRWEELRQATHQLKGAAGSYGFEPITYAAAALEDCLRRKGSEADVATLFESLIGVCRRAVPGPARSN